MTMPDVDEPEKDAFRVAPLFAADEEPVPVLVYGGSP
jgi:hypothetical protein